MISIVKNISKKIFFVVFSAMLPLIKRIIKWMFRLKVTGIEHLRFTGKTIIVPNHVSLLDPIILALFLPKNVAFAVNTGISRKFSWIMMFRSTVAVDPLNPYSVRKMLRGINANQPLCIFPEGRINVASGGAMMKVYGGIGYLALSTGAEIYPVAIDGLEYSKLSYLKGKLRQSWRPRVTISVGQPFTVVDESADLMRVKKERATEYIRSQMIDHLVRSRLKPNVNFFNELIDMAQVHGPSFVVCEDAVPLDSGKPAAAISYSGLLKGAYVLGSRLKQVLASDRRVGVLLPNSAAHMVVLFALFRIGKTPAMINYSAGRQAILDACETGELKYILTSEAFVKKAGLNELIAALSQTYQIVYMEEVRNTLQWTNKASGFIDYLMKRRVSEGDNEIVLFTSGSESKPKGVCLTHGNIHANIQQARAVIPFNSTDRILGALPLFHSLGLCTQMFLPIVTGLKVYMYPSPLHYKVIPELVYDKNITILVGTPTFLAAYARTAHPFDFAHSLKYVIAGAEKLKDEIRQTWQDKFHITVMEGYGTTETSPIISLNTKTDYRKGSVGRLLPATEYRLQPVPGIDNGGNLIVAGPQVMKGYLIHGKGFVPCNREHETGDLAVVDPAGATLETPYLYLKDRIKRIAKIGGEMVPLNLIEEICTGLLEEAVCAAVNIPDARKGERVILYHTHPDAKFSVLKERFKASGHSPLFMPSQLRYIDKLPLLGSGKTDYVTLKQLALQDEEGTNAI
ncbi:AMP-binding protein [Paenibacillus allorhizosphaerae]|uniref:Bifunctional protein Aas n=1 Tax=Paenibacillus allorhizosphaerae TaxID=2849866 RepID=A0ABN7TTA7_9BACL|nr:AMP-binding protein [Paenibacillus allorhizosphaerae]CAG7654958.1 Bifunctional protein Aas [Paenibacillus allorhizosphaerae]